MLSQIQPQLLYNTLEVIRGLNRTDPARRATASEAKKSGAGTARSEKTGICLEAFTTEPAIQFYSGNFMHLDPVPHGKFGVRYLKNGGFCFEAQHYPDPVRHPQFPSIVLRPGETYTQKTIYRFLVDMRLPEAKGCYDEECRFSSAGWNCVSDPLQRKNCIGVHDDRCSSFFLYDVKALSETLGFLSAVPHRMKKII